MLVSDIYLFVEEKVKKRSMVMNDIKISRGCKTKCWKYYEYKKFF